MFFEKRKIKVIVSDLDGTLLYGRNILTERTIKCIKTLKEKGYEFVIATGRGYDGIRDILKELGDDIYTICNNGATIYDKKGEVIYNKLMDKECVEKILEIVKKYDIYYSCFVGNIVYEDIKNREKWIERNYFERKEFSDTKEVPNLNKIVIGGEPEQIFEISKKLKSFYDDEVEITISSPKCIDIVAKGCDKGEGLKKVATFLKVKLDEIMAFGDGENDMSMLESVGVPVVMENAIEKLKNRSFLETKKNTEDGVAIFLEEYLGVKKS